MTTIKGVKKRIREELGGGMPVNKMQVKSPALGFLKDGITLAVYNIGKEEEEGWNGPGTVLELVPKVRGRRK